MWKTYTRESPARHGLAAVSAGLALVGTVALAWVVTHRAHPVRVESLSYWPFSFSLPDRFELVSLQQGDEVADWIDGTYGHAVYRSGHSGGTVIVLSVAYRLLGRSASLKDAAEEMAQLSPDKGRPLAFEPFQGILFKDIGQGGIAGATVVGLSPDGLAVCLQSAASDSRAAGGITDICTSFQPRPWFAPRPPWAPNPVVVK